jgi:hypothetical protein
VAKRELKLLILVTTMPLTPLLAAEFATTRFACEPSEERAGVAQSREGIREQQPIAPCLRCYLHVQHSDEHSHCLPNVPVIVDHNDSEESEFRQLLALCTLR